MKPKRLISLLVAVCMMITMLPLSAVTAFAVEPWSDDPTADDGVYKYAYKVNEDGSNTATITKFLGPVNSANTVDSANPDFYDIKIPATLGGHTVTGLGEYSFSGYLSAAQSNEPYQFGRNIHSVTIPQSVTSIGDYAFSRCEKMDSLTINDATTSIGSWAFDECYKLTTLSLGKNITTIGDYAFLDCHTLDNVTIPPSVTSIGKSAFYRCYALTTLSLGENIEKIGSYAFAECGHLTNVTIPEKVKTIEPYTFGWCTSLKYITLPAGLTSFKDRLVSCPAGFTKQSPKNGAIYYNNDKTAAERLRDNPDDQSESYHILANRNFLYLCNVIFDANGGSLNDDAEVPVYKTEKITKTKANKLTAIPNPTRTGYNFTGWYTTADGKPEDGKFDVNNTAITDDITLYAGWEPDPNAPVCHPLTVTGGIVTVKNGDKDVTDTLTVTTDETTGQKTYYVPDNATVTVTLDKTLIPEGMVFDIWSTGKFSLPLGQDYKAESITFTMSTMSSDADIAAQYRDASIEDDGPNVLGTAAIIGTAAVGTAVLGYQAYSLGAEFAGKLMALPYFPSNRSALAMMLWEDAGKPMPESELLYPDVGQEEQDMDLQHAARWAMENELIPDLNDEGTAPEEMKFFPANPVSKLDVLNAWQKAQELKNN